MTSSSNNGAGRVRILRGGEEGAPAARTLSFAPLARPSERSQNIDDQLRAMRQAGYDEGYQAGLAEARRSLESAESEALRRITDALLQAAAAACDARNDMVRAAERDAVELAFELAESLLQRELTVSRSAAADALVRALGLVPRGEDLVVRLHPDEIIEVDDLQALVPDSAIRIVHDPAVELGGCLVEAGPCRIDAQIGTAIERARGVIESLIGETMSSSGRAR